MPSLPPDHLSRMPVLGWMFRYFRWLRSNAAHRREVLEPIANAIIAQLEKRPTDGPWPVTPEHKVLARIVSDAVATEKGLLASPALHPDDPYPLLFWGPHDDITPLTVIVETRKRLSREIPEQLTQAAWNERWTIRRFIEECIRITPFAR
jgi:hypothetical protein